MFEAVIFDWDGTLADTRQVVVASFQKALGNINCKVSGEFIERLIGIGSAETFREILRFSQMHFDEVLIKCLVEKKIRNEIEMSGEVKLFDGALDLLEHLRGRVKLGLASMNDREVISNLLKMTNVQKFFGAVLTASDVSNPKPNPEIFLKCASKLGISSERCVVVEDSVFGVEAAKKARMSCIAVLTGVYSRMELENSGADLVVSSLREKEAIHHFVLK